jgi:plastocyanin
MAITDIIPRDLNHPFDPANPGDLTEFRQHGCSIPACTDLQFRIPLSRIDPEVVGGEDRDRILNLVVPELARIPTPDGSALATPDRVVADRFFFRQMAHGIFVPDGKSGTVEVWSFDDTGPNQIFDVWPAPTIRAREGDMVHTMLTTRRGTHTIHHHGIEPTTMNDGVGHISFEVDGGGYTYQWLAREAGTYFYHCHKNTVLHFEMGMYGFLIIDPPEPDAPYVDGGPGAIRVGNDIVRYDQEKLWAVDELDFRWHSIVGKRVDSGVECDFYHATIDGIPIPGTNIPMPDGPDPLMHRFEPTIFTISGVAVDQTQGPPPWMMTDPRVAITAQRGQKVVLRLLCAGYTTQVFRFGLPCTLIEVDNRTLGYGPRQQYSHPETIPAKQPFEMTTARKKVFLFDTTDIAPKTYPMRVDFIDWVNGRVWGTVIATFTVTP